MAVHMCVRVNVCVCVRESDRRVEGPFLLSAGKVFHLGHGLEGQSD